MRCSERELTMFNNAMKKILAETSAKAENITKGQTFYTDEQGLKRCAVCNKRLETRISVPGLGVQDLKVNCVCDCTEKQREKYHQELKMLERQAELGKLQSETFAKDSLKSMTFDKDDSPNSYVSKACRAWVSRYTPQSSKWLFLYGNCGTGKTFYAACIANAMLLKGYSVKFETLQDIEARLFGSKNKADVYEELAKVDIMILDDMMSDRMSDYTYEILFKIVDDRYKNDKTMIITTNMTDEETGNPKTRQAERIMSRFWEKSLPIKCDGKDRRKDNSAWSR